VPKKKFDSSVYKIQFDSQLHLGNMRAVALLPESFSGKTADSDRAVILALIEWGLEKRAYTIHPGVRGIAVEAGKAPTTVSVAIRRLQQKGWLKVIYTPGGFESKAQQISLNWNQDKFLNRELQESLDNLITKQLDIWNGNGLGMNAKIVYQVILQFSDGKRLFELKKLTRLSEKQCRSALGKLIDARLVVKLGLLYLDNAPSDYESQIALVNDIRSSWRIDDKEHARLERFANDRMLRKKTLESPQVQRIKQDKYRNKG